MPSSPPLFRKILVLDEVTSALDVASERAISDTLRHLAATKLIIAHRQGGGAPGGHRPERGAQCGGMCLPLVRELLPHAAPAGHGCHAALGIPTKTGIPPLLPLCRLSTVRRADSIAVIVDGSVAEQGSHARLLALGGRYAQLINTAELGAYWVHSGASDSSSGSSSDEGDAPAAGEQAAVAAAGP